MQCSQPSNNAFRETEDNNRHKKRKMIIPDEERENYHSLDYASNNNFRDRHFLYISKKDCDSVFQTEDWQPTGSVLFVPLMEDILVNTHSIEQFTCNQGNFFVADQNGQYSRTASGNVLHLWRFCSNKYKLFISRSFFFKNPQDFYEVQQALQRL